MIGGVQEIKTKVLEHVFVAFDMDSTGHVDPAELQLLGRARQQLGQKTRDWTQDKNENLIELLDKDRNGRIDCLEFVRGFSARVPGDMGQFLQLTKEFHEVRCSCVCHSLAMYSHGGGV